MGDDREQQPSTATGAVPLTPLETPFDFITPQLTWKSAGTGMILGGLL